MRDLYLLYNLELWNGECAWYLMQSTCTMAGNHGGMLNGRLQGWPNTWIHMHKCNRQGSHIPDCLLGIHFAMGGCWVHGCWHNSLALVSRWWGVNGGMLSRHHHVYILAIYGEGGLRAGGTDVVAIPSSKTTSRDGGMLSRWFRDGMWH